MTAISPGSLSGNAPPQPAFKRIAQTNEFDCGFACVAMIAGKELPEIRQLAIDKFGHPKFGPYWISADLIAKLLMHFGWLGTVYKEMVDSSQLPDLAILLVEYDEETEIGRNTVFHRMRPKDSKVTVEYVVDPAYWVDPKHQVRKDFQVLKPAWFIGVTPTSKAAGPVVVKP